MKVRKRIRTDSRLRKAFLGLCAAVLIFSGVPAISLAEEDGTSDGKVVAEQTAADVGETPSDDQPSSNGAADQKTDKASDSAFPSGNANQFADPANKDNAEVEKDTGQEGSISIEALADEVDNEKATADGAALIAASPLRSVSGGVGTLNVQLSNSSDDFEDVSTFVDQTVDWPIGDLRTMRVDFEFGTGSDKQIKITVPSEYRIVGWSATDETPEVSSKLQNISIDPQYSDYFRSSTIVGVDGTTAWRKQVLPDNYLPRKSTTAESVRTFGGIATYTFSDSTTRGQLVMTLRPYQEVLSHTAETELLNAITVKMSSSQGSVISSFRGNVTGLSITNIGAGNNGWGYREANVVYDSETGLSGQFGVLSNVDSISKRNSFGGQLVCIQSWTSTITYPKGVSFDNKIFCDYLRMGDVETSGGEIVPDHFTLEVTGDKTTGGTVKFIFTNTTFYHSSGESVLGAYFTADRNLAESENLSFATTASFSNRGKTAQCAINHTRHLVSGDGKYLIDIKPANEYRRDIHADYPNYPYEYAIGGFELQCKLPYTNVPLSFDFTNLNGVRGVGAPGSNIHDIVAKTTEGRTITLANVDGASDEYYGVPITPEQLGLSGGEFLTTLSFVADLDQITYKHYYARGLTYFGHFVDGQEGDVSLSIMDDEGQIALNNENKPITATDHTTIRWEKSGGFWMSTTAQTEDGTAASTFHPNEKIVFHSYLSGGTIWSDADTLIDPIIMISLPKGINLDIASIRARSELGNHPNQKIALRQVKTPLVMDIDGVEWTTYYFTSPEPLDMIAMEQYAGTSFTGIDIDFNAYVASNTPEHGQISLKDCVQWDLRANAWTSYDWVKLRYQDVNNRAGHGTDYYVDAIGNNFTIKPLIGLNVDLGIRVKDSDVGFFTFDTTDSSIAPITKTKNAEVRISYENTASTDYFQGSSIFLPIPRVGHDYSKYFQNIELKDPLNKTTNKAFEFNTYLKTQIALSGFDTYYAIDATENTEAYDPSANAGTWEPVTVTRWYSYDELISSSHSLSDVIMVKLVASENVATGVSANGTFELSIDNDARIGQLDYWRAYSKAITDSDNNTGVWNHSSVLAATPASDGLIGQLFIDSNNDGYFGTVDGDSAYTAGNVTAILNRDDGTMANLALTVQPDGSFRSLNDNGTVYFLKSGDYTITFTNVDETYVFSRVPGSQSSDGSAWYNDLRSSGIKGSEAEYHFTVDESSELASFVGIALTDFVEVISVDVPVRVNIALNTDGTWCTPTALRNRIINRSTCAMHVASAVATTKSDFGLQSTSNFTTSGLDNALAGTIAPADSAGATTGTPQDLTSISTAGDKWTMPLGQTRAGVAVADGTNELPLQLAGSIRSVEGHYFTAPINVFDITYTFEKAGE